MNYYHLGYMHCISFLAIHVNLVAIQKHQKYYREKKYYKTLVFSSSLVVMRVVDEKRDI